MRFIHSPPRYVLIGTVRSIIVHTIQYIPRCTNGNSQGYLSDFMKKVRALTNGRKITAREIVQGWEIFKVIKLIWPSPAD